MRKANLLEAVYLVVRMAANVSAKHNDVAFC